MNELLLDISSRQILLSSLQGEHVADPIRIENDGTKHPLLWIASALQVAPAANSIVVSTCGQVRGGVMKSQLLGQIDLVDLLDTQLRAPAIVLPQGQAAALAAGEEEPLLAVHLGDELQFGFWTGEEVWTGNRGRAGEGHTAAEEVLDLYEDASGMRAPWSDFFRAYGEGEDAALIAMHSFQEQVLSEIEVATRLLDPASVVLSGGPLLHHMETELMRRAGEFLPGGDVYVSPRGELAPLLGAARVVSPSASL